MTERGTMKNKNSLYIIQLVSVAGYLICAVSVIVMAAIPVRSGINPVAVLSGVMFWSGIAAGVAGQIVLLKKTRGLISGKIGLISFFTNRFGFLADAVLVLSVSATVLTVFLSDKMGVLTFIIWSLLIFSFSMHCVLNGRKFNYIYRLITRRSVRNEKSS